MSQVTNGTTFYLTITNYILIEESPKVNQLQLGTTDTSKEKKKGTELVKIETGNNSNTNRNSKYF